MDHKKQYSQQRFVLIAATSVAVRPLLIVVGIVRTGVLFHLLNLDVYGVFIILSSLLTQFDFLDGGLRQSLQRYIPDFLAHDRKRDIGRALTATFLIMLVVGGLVGMAVAGFAYFGGGEIFSGGGHKADFGNSIYVAAVALGMLWPLTTFQATMEGLNHFNETVILKLFSDTLAAVFVVGGAMAHLDVTELFVLNLAPPILMQLFLALRIYQVLGILFVADDGCRQILKEIFHYSKWVAISQLGGAINTSMDKPIVGAALGVHAVPVYFALRQATQSLSLLSTLLHSVVLPTSSHRLVEEGLAGLKRLILNATRAQMAFIAPFVVLLVLLARPLLKTWAGPALVPYALEFQIGSFLFLVIASTKVLNRAAMARDQDIRFLTVYGIIDSFFSSIAIFYSGRFWGVGAAFLASVIWSVLIFPFWYWVVLRRLAIDPLEYFLGSVARGVLPAIVILAALFVPSYWLPETSSPLALLLIATPLTLLVLGASYLFGLDANTRAQFRGLFSRLWQERQRRIEAAQS